MSSEMTARDAGRKAFQQGVLQIDNPFMRYSSDWDLWREGWLDAWHEVMKRNGWE
jgi:hypothetical protein